MHDNGLHYFDPKDQEFTFVKTVSENKEGFTAIKTKGGEADRSIYATLIYS